MDITDEMLQAAVRKAIEAGLLPRNACREDAEGSKELMRLIVHAAMSAMADEAHRPFDTPSYARPPGRAVFPSASDARRTIPAYAFS